MSLTYKETEAVDAFIYLTRASNAIIHGIPQDQEERFRQRMSEEMYSLYLLLKEMYED